VRLRCPVCGKAPIAARPFKIKARCTACRAVFKREEGFFVGAILANVVTTELVILGIYLLTLPFFGTYHDTILALLFLVAVTFPVIFYHHSWSLWLGFDHLIEALPQDVRNKRWG
jgi:hypothetical protein